jgi:hypothetical protein
MRTILEAVMGRITILMMGDAEEKDLDTRHEILYENLVYKIVDEIGGNEARYYLFTKGLNAYASLVARKSDGRFVWSIGRRTQYIIFPIKKIFQELNQAEELPPGQLWDGSNLVGGSPRRVGSSLGPIQLAEHINKVLREEGLLN